MGIPKRENESKSPQHPVTQVVAPVKKKVPFYKYDTEEFKKFFDLTGGSLLYCLSAAFVAYGIVKVMGPLLSNGQALKEALPCIFTLHAYELALLGVLILIVSRKVVDDAISVVIIMALFLVGTSIALGSVANTGISESLWLGGFGVFIAFVKFSAMKQFARIPFKALSFLGLGILVACNYFGPAILARSIAAEVLPESTRREIWWVFWLTLMTGSALIIIEAMKTKAHQQTKDINRTPFLQSPVMVYLFSLIVVACSGTHQYAMAYASGLQRVIGDYVPVSLIAVLFVLEILRNLGKRFGVVEIVISCVPLSLMIFAIDQRSVLSSSAFGFGLLGYPPVTFALSGLIIVGWSLYNRRFKMLTVGFLYVLGIILTWGFSPERPYDLNIHSCVISFVIAAIIYGLIRKNQYLCVTGIIALCVDLSQLSSFVELSKSLDLTTAGGLAGVYGLSTIILCVIFGGKMHKVLRGIGALCLIVFAFDYLPKDFHWRYVIVLAGTILIAYVLWLRTRDLFSASIIWLPSVIKLYIAGKCFGHWRSVIVGFLLLGAGVFASILKLRLRNRVAKPNKIESGSGSPPV
jgi:hypothetical protein